MAWDLPERMCTSVTDYALDLRIHGTGGRPGTHFYACKALYPSSILGAASQFRGTFSQE